MAVSGLRIVGIAGAGVVLLVVVLIGAAAVALVSVLTGGAVIPSASATTVIPSSMLTLYEQAAVTCPGLPWTVLAAIGTVESSNGTSDLPGVHSGANFAGAEGPMQFEPATFAEYDLPVPPGGAEPPSPYDPTDAVYAAARLLCANGAANGTDLSAAVFAFNHDTSYVTEVLDLGQSFGQSAAGPWRQGRQRPRRRVPRGDLRGHGWRPGVHGRRPSHRRGRPGRGVPHDRRRRMGNRHPPGCHPSGVIPRRAGAIPLLRTAPTRTGE